MLALLFGQMSWPEAAVVIKFAFSTKARLDECYDPIWKSQFELIFNRLSAC